MTPTEILTRLDSADVPYKVIARNGKAAFTYDHKRVLPAMQEEIEQNKEALIDHICLYCRERQANFYCYCSDCWHSKPRPTEVAHVFQLHYRKEQAA